MNKIIAPITENPEQRQLSVAKVMDVALAPFRLREELTDAKLLAWQVRHLVERNSDGEIVALKRATDQPQRWRLHDAHEAIDMMPPLKQIHSAYQTIANSIITKPTYTERKMLAGMLLDGCGIRADEGTAAWVEAVAWTLGECERRTTEFFDNRKPWMPMPAIAAAIRKIWLTQRDNYGRPIPIADFLDECGRHSSDLLSLQMDIINIGRTHQRLTQIVQATDDSYPDDDWGDDEPEEGSKS
jgi:hypothetical protein